MTEHNIAKIKHILLDMDGVLWRDNQPIVNLPAIFSKIARRDWHVALVTNNATRTIDQYVQKLHGFGVELPASQIINSAQAAGNYLKKRYPSGGNVFVVGEDALVQSLLEYGFTHGEDHALAVVVALDRDLTYEKLSQATLLIRSGVPFIATNPDRTFPTPQGLVPGTGSILAALEAATETVPVIVGKPAPQMYWFAMERISAKPETTLVVGDRLETDIVGAQELGCLTALVLSGVTPPEKAYSWQPKPHWISPDLSSLLDEI